MASSSACSDEDAGADSQRLAAADSGVQSDASASPSEGAIYAFRRGVATPDQWNAYVHITDAIVAADTLDDARGREFDGDVFEAGGALFVSSALDLTRYSIDDARGWGDTQTLSFSDYPLSEDGPNFYFMFRVDAHTAYLQVDTWKRVVWDPTDMEIEGFLEDSTLPLEQNGHPLRNGGNITDYHHEGPTLMTYFYNDDDWIEFGPTSYVALYSRATHREERLIEIPCPGINTISRDDDGYIYLSSSGYNGLSYRYDPSQPEPCIARLTPDYELDTDFTTHLTELTDGRYGTGFQYVRNGWAVMSVLLHEELGVEPSKGDGKIPAEVLEASYEKQPWEVWVIDLKRKQAHPFEALNGTRGRLDQGALSQLDGRSFLSVEYSDDANATRTKLYELNDDASAEEIDDFSGGGKWMRLR